MTKGRDSGMPPVEQWESYFDAAGILESLGCNHLSGDAIEFGCDYGAFTILAAQRLSGTVYALDIDPFMVAATLARVSQADLKNVVVEQRDFLVDGCGRAPRSASFIGTTTFARLVDRRSISARGPRSVELGVRKQDCGGSGTKVCPARRGTGGW